MNFGVDIDNIIGFDEVNGGNTVKAIVGMSLECAYEKRCKAVGKYCLELSRSLEKIKIDVMKRASEEEKKDCAPVLSIDNVLEMLVRIVDTNEPIVRNVENLKEVK